MKTIGGKAISLNDFAGKMTMLVFASFDQSYYTETFEKLKTAWQPFENSLACFYVSVYDKPSSIEYIQQSQLEETTGLIDDNSRKSVYGSYGISSLPVLILIDENGTVLLRNPSKVVLKNTILNLLK
ncbi:MAG: redoxin domain-containing protein [Planctomycetes bacterium]|nr:redoxin domain-containing protein [Planctomycetota bacterium]